MNYPSAPLNGGEVEICEQLWNQLHELAVEAMGSAYAPYSRYPVGAAAVTADGRFVTGCNVENAAYGIGLCAECGLVSELVRTGGGRLVAFACVNSQGEALVPCGRCRQLLYEHGGAELLLWMPAGITPMKEVLPAAFGPEDILKVGGNSGLE
ncbi:cytidine deaminase [Actinomycetaceae bacterium TAE3-ERU4]|nr:cytidine deaminase [Actinomycetaceae bacterium TAE3-ERU4]